MLHVLISVTLEASATFLREGNKTMAFFYCKTGKSQLYFLNHVLTWSKIGQDGRERYLSINWDLVQHGKNMGYHVESRTESVFAGLRGSMMDEPVMFIMWKKGILVYTFSPSVGLCMHSLFGSRD